MSAARTGSLVGSRYRRAGTAALGGFVFSACVGLCTVWSAPAGEMLNVTTLAGLAGVDGNSDGTGSVARFWWPARMAVDSTGVVFVADLIDDSIRKVTPAGVVTTLNIPGGILSSPEGLAFDSSGNLYVANTSDHTILKITPTGMVGIFAGASGTSGSADGPGAAAHFNGPTDVTVDGSGNVYVADSMNHTIRRISPAGDVSTLAGLAGASGFNDGTGAVARFSGPNGLSVDVVGTIYVSDGGNNAIRKVSPAGGVTTLAGGSWGYTDGNGINAEFREPKDIALDSTGALYVTDYFNHVIRKVTQAGVVTTVAGTAGQTGAADGIGPAASFDHPLGVAVAPDGTVYISDSYNNTVRSSFITGTTVAAPTFSPPPGSYNAAQTVTITCATPGATIFFTTDGSDPTPYSTVYPGPLTITATTTIKALATRAGMTDSAVAFGLYIIVGGTGGGGNPDLTVVNVDITGVTGGGVPVYGGGTDIIPSFTQNIGGGTGPVTVTFDPSTTYLPVSQNPNQVYTYQAIWNFGDGFGALVGAAGGTTAANALMSVSHTYNGEAIYIVNLRIDIIIYNLDPVTHQPLPLTDPSRSAKGPSAFTTGQVHVGTVNFPPTPRIVNLSSPATGTVPYEVQLDPSASFDEDGFIVWAAIDWGDGTSELVSPLPPTVPPVLLKHAYAAPGIYRVTLSVIDNGRMKLGTALPSTPDPRDPMTALALVLQAHAQASSADATFLDPKYSPQLKQDYIFVQVPGNMVVLKGLFKLDFRRQATDKFDCLLRSNLFPENLANATVLFSLGAGAPPLTLPVFHTDARGRFQDQGLGLLFRFDARKQLLRIKLSHAQLAAAFGLVNTTAVNTKVDVPITILLNNSLNLSATARFTYNASAGSKGLGKDGHSYPDGN